MGWYTTAPKFWVVWSPRGGKPKIRHQTLIGAATEASRLSIQFPGRHFHVLERVGFAMEGEENDQPATPRPKKQKRQEAKSVRAVDLP